MYYVPGSSCTSSSIGLTYDVSPTSSRSVFALPWNWYGRYAHTTLPSWFICPYWTINRNVRNCRRAIGQNR